jgi:hypothetical protein
MKKWLTRKMMNLRPPILLLPNAAKRLVVVLVVAALAPQLVAQF